MTTQIDVAGIAGTGHLNLFGGMADKLRAEQSRPRGARLSEAHREAPYVVEMQQD